MSTDTTPVVEYLTTTHIGEKGQLTVPKQYRNDVGLEPGAPLAVLRIGDGLIIMPEQERFNALCESISSALEGADIAEADLQSTLPEARSRIFARHYPEISEREPVKHKRKRR